MHNEHICWSDCDKALTDALKQNLVLRNEVLQWEASYWIVHEGRKVARETLALATGVR